MKNNSKTVLSVLIAALLLLSLGILCACNKPSDGCLRYEINSDGTTCSVIGIGDEEGEVVIPNWWGRNDAWGLDSEYPVTQITNRAFQECQEITSIFIPNTITHIGELAFNSCGNLKKIIIPDTIEYIGVDAFRKCDRLKFNQYDNALYLGNENNKYLVLVRAINDQITSCEINPNAKIICDSAFKNCNYLDSIVIPEGVSFVGEDAFVGCKYGIKITLPNTLSFLGDNALVYSESKLTIWHGGKYFGNTENKYLILIGVEDATAIQSLTIHEKTKFINSGALSFCRNLQYVYIPQSICAVGSSAFSNCESLTNITLPEGIKYLGNYIFAGCDNLQIINYNTKSANCSSATFERLSNVESIWIGDTVEIIPDRIFGGLTAKVIHIGKSVKQIGRYAFGGTSNVATLYYDAISCNGLVYDNGAFSGMGSNAPACEVIFGKNVKSIPKNLFAKRHLSDVCITSVKFDEQSKCDTVGSFAFEGCSRLTDLLLGTCIKTIGAYSFQDCRMRDLYIPATLKYIGYSAFNKCDSLTNVYLDDIANWCAVEFNSKQIGDCNEDEYIYGGNYKSSNPFSYADNLYYGNSLVNNLIIPNGTKEIKDDVFAGCESITSVTISESVKSIGHSAFACVNLKDLYINDLKSWCEVSLLYGSNPMSHVDNVYANGEKITNLVIPDGVTSIGSFCFGLCDNIETVTFADSVTRIEPYAFHGCGKLREINLGKTVFIGEQAFDSCVNLTQITLPQSIEKIEDNAFLCCWSLIEVCNESRLKLEKDSSNGGVAMHAKNIYNTQQGKSRMELIGDYLMYYDDNFAILVKYCGEDTTIILPEEIGGKEYEINQYAFASSAISYIKIPSKIKIIYAGVFRNCKNLSRVDLPNVSGIWEYAFSGCDQSLIINYNGTKTEWEQMTRSSSWNWNSNKITIHCTDGEITADSRK